MLQSCRVLCPTIVHGGRIVMRCRCRLWLNSCFPLAMCCPAGVISHRRFRRALRKKLNLDFGPPPPRSQPSLLQYGTAAATHVMASPSRRRRHLSASSSAASSLLIAAHCVSVPVHADEAVLNGVLGQLDASEGIDYKKVPCPPPLHPPHPVYVRQSCDSCFAATSRLRLCFTLLWRCSSARW